MTVEAAVILPFFMMALLSFLSFIDILAFQNKMTMALRDVGMSMSVYGYVYDYLEEGAETDLAGIVPNMVLSYAYAGIQVEKFLGEDYIEKTGRDLGLSTIHYYNSSVMEEDDVIDLVATFSMTPRFNLLGLPEISMLGRYYGRAWTGYELDGSCVEEQPEENVYITSEGEVYHLSRYCTHIQLTITTCVVEDIQKIKNNAGDSYRPCLLCGNSGNSGKYYITPEGDCFHSELNCQGLKRTVDIVPLSQVNGRTRCSRCGGGSGD